MSTSAPATTLRTREDLPPVGVVRDPRPTTREKVIFGAIGIVAAVAWFVIALQRGEHVSAAWFVMAAVGSYLLALRFYGRLIERKLHQPDDTRATPAEAEWLIASEKKAMRKLTTRMPITAVMGASRSSPTMACCMKRTCMHSNGRIWATRA